MDRPERALVVTPHADDAEIGCGGTVAGWIAEGSKVFYVLCTNGDKGTSDPDMTSETPRRDSGAGAVGGGFSVGNREGRISPISRRRA